MAQKILETREKKRAEGRFPLRLGAVDVGSNAVRLLAAEVTAPNRYRVLEERRDAVRLGHGVFLTGKLAAQEMDQAVQVFRLYRERMEALGVKSYRAVATSAVRDSDNGAQFLVRVKKEAGLDLAAINGSEEARLVHRAVAGRMDLSDGTWMLVDLGGGSVEVSLADGAGVLWSESHTVGAVRLLEELTGSSEDPGRFLRLLTEYVGTLRVPAALERERPRGLAATGGNIETLAQMALAPQGRNGVSRLPVEDLSRLISKLSSMSYRERVDKLHLREDRADVILPAALVYERLALLARVEVIHVPFVGVKDGIVLDLADALASERTAQERRGREVEQAALALGRKYRFDEAHGLHVAKVALALFDQLKGRHGMGAEERRILQAAALLHDVGSFVSYKGHHKHSLYLLTNSNLAGFSPREVQLVANVARYHRRSPPKPQHEAYAALDEPDRDRVTRLASLLRLADALDREHRQTVREVKAKAVNGALKLQLSGKGDMLLEAWALKKKSDLFQRTFRLDVEVTVLDRGEG
jgi:exopolyphosphatase/guanosine-5'-triphosphate,3'-diphosphate pyrophosphatase